VFDLEWEGRRPSALLEPQSGEFDEASVVRHTTTLYTRPDGSLSTVYFVAANNRMHADWNASILFDDFRLGFTLNSVLY
jgi:hypothetical protein